MPDFPDRAVTIMDRCDALAAFTSEEWRLGHLHRLAPEVLAGLERDFPGPARVAIDERTVDSSIRIRHERYDDVDHSIIEADLDRDSTYELAIVVEGTNLPFYIQSHLS